MEAPRYTAKEIEDGLYSGMDPDVELVAAQYYDQMKAERDEWKRLWTDHQRCAQCGDWGYGEICRVCVVTAERDEIQRRLDAVVAMLVPGEKPKYCSFDTHRIYRELYKEWEWKIAAHARAVAIAEGREL